MKLLLEQKTLDLNFVDQNGNTAFDYACFLDGEDITLNMIQRSDFYFSIRQENNSVSDLSDNGLNKSRAPTRVKSKRTKQKEIPTPYN